MCHSKSKCFQAGVYALLAYEIHSDVCMRTDEDGERHSEMLLQQRESGYDRSCFASPGRLSESMSV
jgi:hypothetical protein